MIEHNNSLWDVDPSNVGNSIVDDSLKFDADSFEARLNKAIIPLCRKENEVKSHLEHMLIQRLNFPTHLAKTYSMLCLYF